MNTNTIICWVCFIVILIAITIVVLCFLSKEKFKRIKLRKLLEEAMAQNNRNKVGQHKYTDRLYEETNKRRIAIGQKYND